MTAAALALLALAVAIGLAITLAGQIRQRKTLRAWLDAPELHTIPDGSGAWSEVFSRLQALRKKERRQHLELGNALERFRLAAEALPDGVILLDDAFHIGWLNPAACRHFSLDPARDIGTLISQLIRKSEFHDLLTVFRSKRLTQPTQLRVGANGNERVFSLQLIAFADAGILLLSTDVTERERTEAVHRDFIANVSHELRTPLTVISGFLEQFNAPEPPQGEAARRFHHMMAEQAERMNRLVADLLTLSRLENSDQPPRDECVDVSALIEALQREAEAVSAGKHNIEIAEVSVGNLRGSADELRSAFGNLVFNAVRYTPEGGRIILSWHAVAGAPTFAVTDSGIGIPSEHIPRLTERFYRVDKGRSSATGGTGLGLAIVKHVLARHGGELEIQSVPGKGSTFSARLPRERLL